MARVSSVGDDDIIKFIEGPDGTPVTVAGAEHEITVADLATSLGVGSGTVMDTDSITWAFEIVPHGGTGSANPAYPEIEAAVDGTLDLSTLPTVTFTGPGAAGHLFANYSAASKHSIEMPNGVGHCFYTVSAAAVGVPDATADLELQVASIPTLTYGLATDAAVVGDIIGLAAGEYFVLPMPFTAGRWAGYTDLIALGASTEATTGSWLVQVILAIEGFIPTTPRDNLPL
jgi:hypothetical protein